MTTEVEKTAESIKETEQVALPLTAALKREPFGIEGAIQKGGKRRNKMKRASRDL